MEGQGRRPTVVESFRTGNRHVTGSQVRRGPLGGDGGAVPDVRPHRLSTLWAVPAAKPGGGGHLRSPPLADTSPRPRAATGTAERHRARNGPWFRLARSVPFVPRFGWVGGTG